MSLSREFSRVREKVTFGWEFTGIVESPYFNKFKEKGEAPLMARFDWWVWRDGVKDPGQKILSEQSAMKALSLRDIEDGRIALIHNIPKELVESAKPHLIEAMEARHPKANSTHVVVIYAPRQMAAAIPSEGLQFQMKG